MFNHLQHAIMVNQRLSLARSPNPKIISSPGWREHPNKNVRAEEFSKQKLQGLVHFSLLEIDSFTEFSTCNRAASEVLNDSVHLAFWKLQVEANGSTKTSLRYVMYIILFCELGSANFPAQPYKHEVPASFQIPISVLWCRHTAMVVSSTEATRGCSQPEPRLHKAPSRDNITAAQICVSTTEMGQCQAIMSCQ